MSRKDYVVIAEAIARITKCIGPGSTPLGTIHALSYDISMALRADNPRFNQARFLAACFSEDVRRAE